MLYRGIDVTSGALQGAAFEDGASTGFSSQHLHGARGSFRGICARDTQTCAGAHKESRSSIKSDKQFSHCFPEECPCGAEMASARPTAECKISRSCSLTVIPIRDFFLRGRFHERCHRTACDPQRCPGNRPRKYGQPRYPVNDARLARHWRDKVVGMFCEDEDILHLEVAAPCAAKPGDVPGVMHRHLLGREVAADRRSAWCGRHPRYGSQSHESGGMAGPAAERPAPANPIASGNGFGQADRAGGG